MENPVWLEVAADTQHETVDTLCAHLAAWGIDSLSIQDGVEFEAHLESQRAHWDFVDEDFRQSMRATCRVCFYLPEHEAHRLPELRAQLETLSEDGVALVVSVGTRQLHENDWAESWKQYYKPIPIGKRLLIQPEWEPLTDHERVVFWNNPGLSFGTGEHETTRLCLTALEARVRAGDSVLDLGCGSGILSVVARLLGAAHCTAVDIDPQAVEVARRNAERNGVSDEYRLFAGNLLTDSHLRSQISDRKYDIIVVNIVADVILELLPLIHDLAGSGSTLVTSGILETRSAELILAFKEAGLRELSAVSENGWCCLNGFFP